MPAGELHSRLAVTRGIVPAPRARERGIEFEPGALIPRDEWRPPTQEEFEALTDVPSGAPFSSLIGIERCEQSLVARARRIFDDRQAGTLTPRDAKQRGNALARDIAAWIDSATDWRVIGEIADLSIFHNDVGKPTVSFDPDTLVHVGLHMDSFDRFPDYLRQQASNRFCINLGVEDRYFLFVDKQAIGLLGELAQVDEEPPIAMRLATRYLAAFPDSLVWRIRLQPGEAYIAPTENIIHDGSSQLMSSLDVHCTLRGHFKPVASNGEARPDESLAVRERYPDGSLRFMPIAPRGANDSLTPVRLPATPTLWLRDGIAEKFVEPFPLVKVDGAMDARLSGTLYAWLESLDGWRISGGSFYAVGEIDLRARTIPAGLQTLFEPRTLALLRGQLGELFGCAFDARMRIVAHRMNAGDGAGIHCDDPRGTEETHRVVLTLGQDSATSRGGLFTVFGGPCADQCVHAWPATHNQCLLFEADARSFHAITEVRQGTRYSIVLSFWKLSTDEAAPATQAASDVA
ncbi:2OG-Fe(II) oxygenase [Variovorax sp. J22R133]|uniref:2OG-Fe(II) oxygenase n=1 Tax=Variovorax brevis TaxID=3053503 RepID=UPI002578133D|nr:2OG-Fe(II) oxygenase [Variovorax sp. J22R133]MDM0112636.1 2OG-Fe(II) oxygenase [Variovorax sp. J22R133]